MGFKYVTIGYFLMQERILFVTGDRAEYDLLKPVADAVLKTKKFEVGFFVAGTHQLDKFGKTIDKIETDGFKIIAKINNLLHSDLPSSRAKSLGIELSSLVDTIDNYEPMMVVVLGDREEALAAATACVYSQVICVHLCGGDSTADGNSDNLIRDAVSKMANIHFPTTEKSKNRLVDMGEDSRRVFNYGATGLDTLVNFKIKPKGKVLKKFGLSEETNDYAVLIQHPILSDLKNSLSDLEASLNALSQIGIPTFIGRPNSDPGSIAFHDLLDRYCRKNGNFFYYKNLNRGDFVNLIHHASVLVGNSSSGIIEAPFLKLPVINVGLRQRGRECSDNVIFVDGVTDKVRAALEKALYDPKFKEIVEKCVNPYGDGKASERIAKKLVEISSAKQKYQIKLQVSE